MSRATSARADARAAMHHFFYLIFELDFIKHLSLDLKLLTAIARNQRGPHMLEAARDGQSAMWLGQPVNTWRITDLIKSVTAPRAPINTPCQWNSTHHTILIVLNL
jgi:hypothetical protein